MTSLDEHERLQDAAQQQAWWDEAKQKPTTQERADLVALAEEGKAAALAAGRIECADWWVRVRAAALANKPLPRHPAGMKN